MSVLYHDGGRHGCGAREFYPLHLRNFMNSDRSICVVKPPALIVTCFQAGNHPLRTQDDQSVPLSIAPNLVTTATTTLLIHTITPLSQKPQKVPMSYTSSACATYPGSPHHWNGVVFLELATDSAIHLQRYLEYGFASIYDLISNPLILFYAKRKSFFQIEEFVL